MTDDTKDLEARLRSSAAETEYSTGDPLCAEAADALAAKDKDIAALRSSHLEEIRELKADWRQEIKECDDQYAALRAERDELIAEYKAVRTENEELSQLGPHDYQHRAEKAEAERDSLATANHRQAHCMHQCGAAIGSDTAATIDGLPKAVRRVVAEAAALRERVEKADRLLKPFSDRAEKLDGLWDARDTNWSPAHGDTAITINDLRAARDFLTTSPDSGETEEGDRCDDCGRVYKLIYRVPNDVWTKIAPKPETLGPYIEHQYGGILCPECADKRARAAGIRLCFVAERQDEPRATGEAVGVNEAMAWKRLFDEYGCHHEGCDLEQPDCSCGMRASYRSALAALSAPAEKGDIEKRLQALEKDAHEPFDFTHLIERLEAVEAVLATPTPSQKGGA